MAKYSEEFREQTVRKMMPRVERPLLRPEHYRMFTGERVKLRLKWPVDEQRNYVGILRVADDREVQLMLENKEVRIPLEAIARGRLLVDIAPNAKGVKR